jgi:hypothetical protein
MDYIELLLEAEEKIYRLSCARNRIRNSPMLQRLVGGTQRIESQLYRLQIATEKLSKNLLEEEPVIDYQI